MQSSKISGSDLYHVLLTMRVGDVIIGAAGKVDPQKVTRVSVAGTTFDLQTSLALPKEGIEFGTATFEQLVNWRQ